MLKNIVFAAILLLPLYAHCNTFTKQEIQTLQNSVSSKGTGEKVAFWAKQFIGTPYDKDIQGAYVTHKVIVYDTQMDCMYLVFRCVELALSTTPEETVDIALKQRFHHHGITKNNHVFNYNDRYQYGEDMIASGKWGKNITALIGTPTKIQGSYKYKNFPMLTNVELAKNINKLKNGDLIFFIKDGKNRTKADEIVGHMGIIVIANNTIYLVHASGTKKNGGKVSKIPLLQYLNKTNFIGADLTRFTS